MPWCVCIRAEGTAFRLNSHPSRLKKPRSRAIWRGLRFAGAATAWSNSGTEGKKGARISYSSISIIVPCHRVIASNGDLGGYGGGTQVKRQLLALEQGEQGELY